MNFPLKNLKIEPLGSDSKVPRQVLKNHLSLVEPTLTDKRKLCSVNLKFIKTELMEGDADENDSVEVQMDQNAIDVLSGKTAFESSPSYSYCYGGHQFGSWAAQLGDGRAIAIAQTMSRKNHLWEWQLKGAGMTPYSRFADGWAVTRSSIREYLCAEFAYALGIPTSRSLSLITTDQNVQREVQEKAAIVCRMAPSWIRFGNFEIFYARDDIENLQILADYCIEYHFPDILKTSQPNVYEQFLSSVVEKTAFMIAQWQATGFCHGVMNTDNFSILGLTIDYGPFQFLDAYDPSYICNHSDETGRYAFMQQPSAALFNLVQFATALSPLLEKENPDKSVAGICKPLLDKFGPLLKNEYYSRMLLKCGFNPDTLDSFTKSELANAIVDPLLELMYDCKMDYNLFFRTLSLPIMENDKELSAETLEKWKACSYLSKDHVKWTNASDDDDSLESRLAAWFIQYLSALKRSKVLENERMERMKKNNPKYVLRNYMVQNIIDEFDEIETEEDREAAKESLNRYLTILQDPFQEWSESDALMFGANRLVPTHLQSLKCSCSS